MDSGCILGGRLVAAASEDSVEMMELDFQVVCEVVAVVLGRSVDVVLEPDVQVALVAVVKQSLVVDAAVVVANVVVADGEQQVVSDTAERAELCSLFEDKSAAC